MCSLNQFLCMAFRKIERQRWLASLPNFIDPERITENFGVCAKHFAPDVPMVRRGSRFVPAAPPTIFNNVPQSCIPATPSQPRPTKKSCSDVRARTQDVDEMEDFMEMDKFGSLSSFTDALKIKFEEHAVSVSKDSKNVMILSQERKGPVHAFSLYCDICYNSDTDLDIYLRCELYKNLKLVKHQSISQNKVTCWCQLEELIRFLRVNTTEESVDTKDEFLLRQIQLQNATHNTRFYSLDDFCLGLKWCTRSRSLYNELRHHIQLPSLTTLARVTRAVRNSSDEDLFKNVLSSLEDRCKNCILIIDEIYVKTSLSYRGGVMFGYAVDQPEKKATTLLCMMVKCMFGGPKFLAKLLPCAGLKATFQFQCSQDLLSSLHKCGARVIAIINDNNRLNQSFFGMFTPVMPAVPWTVLSPTSSPLFLLYDPVHLVKNLRNNWFSEATKTLCLPSKEGNIVAKWKDLEELHSSESASMVKLSKLTKASVCPSNIQKQKVSLTLHVFSDETNCALKTSSASTPSWQATAKFIDLVVKLWKLFNCKSRLQGILKRDADNIAIDLENGSKGLQTLSDWAHFAELLCPDSQVRQRKLTRDTSKALSWTCRCLIDMCKYLLSLDAPASVRRQYVCIGFFLQDDIERHFGHFRMSAGSNYYLTVQDIIRAHCRDQARLMLKVIVTIGDDFDYSNSFHKCDSCCKELSDGELCLLDDMSVFQRTKSNLYFILQVMSPPKLKIQTLWESQKRPQQMCSHF